MQDRKVYFDSKNSGFYFDVESMRTFKVKCSEDKLQSVFDKLSHLRYEAAENLSACPTQKCSVLTLILTNRCNLNCSYCYYHSDTQQPAQELNVNQLFDAFKKIDGMFPGGIEIIQYFGGEPLIRYDIIKEATQMICSYCTEHSRPIPHFGLNTNGLLFTDEIIEMFYDYNFSLSISIDGKEDNNICRCDYTDKPTYAKLVKVIERIRFLHPDYRICAEMTFTSRNVHDFVSTGIHDVEVLHELGFYAIHMVPAILDDGDIGNVFGFGCTQEELYSYVKYAYDYMFANLHSEQPIFIDDYVEIANLLNLKKKKNVFCEAGLSRFALGPDGALYPCHMYLHDKSAEIAQIATLTEERLFNSMTYNYKIRSKQSNKKCLSCWNRNTCKKCSFSVADDRFCEFQRFKSEYLIYKILNHRDV